MFEKILVPVDGSESSKLALSKAIELGNQFGSEIQVLSVAPEANLMRFTASTSNYDGSVNPEVIDLTMSILDGAKVQLKDYANPYEVQYIVGDAAREILRFAENNKIDLIVMGNRGMGAFSRTILGSVSNKVVNSSPASVLVVKHKWY